MNLVPDAPFVEVTSSSSLAIPTPDCASTLKLEIGGAKLEVSNDVNPELLVSVLRFLRGASC